MSFPVWFGVSQKKLNSTYQFPYTEGTVVQCTLKKGTSILKPVLEIQDSWTNVHNNLLECNVAYIAAFRSRYYRVTNWVFNEPLVLVYLEVDVLASFKSQLSVQSFYVTRTSNTARVDPYIIDTAYPTRAGISNAITTYWRDGNNRIVSPLTPATGFMGSFVVGIINDQAQFGAVAYYVLGFNDFMLFIRQLCSINILGNLGDVPESLAKSIVNPFQYIVSAKWYPYTVQEFNSRGWTGSQQVSLTCGYFTVTFAGYAYPLISTEYAIEFTNVIGLTVPKHPGATAANGMKEYLKLAPYTKYVFNFYPFCSTEIDPVYLLRYNALYAWYTVDLRTGRGICKLGTSHQGSDWTDYRMMESFATYEAEVGVDVPLAAIQSMIPSQTQGVILATQTGVETFGGFEQMVKSGLASLGKGVGDLLGFSQEQQQNWFDFVGASPITAEDFSKVATAAARSSSYAELRGMQGALSFGTTNPVTLTGYFSTPADSDPDNFGYPCCKRQTLGDCTGYTVCANARPQLQIATATELQEVTSLLNSGFFWE